MVVEGPSSKSSKILFWHSSSRCFRNAVMSLTLHAVVRLVNSHWDKLLYLLLLASSLFFDWWFLFFFPLRPECSYLGKSVNEVLTYCYCSLSAYSKFLLALSPLMNFRQLKKSFRAFNPLLMIYCLYLNKIESGFDLLNKSFWGSVSKGLCSEDSGTYTLIWSCLRFFLDTETGSLDSSWGLL